MGDTFEFDVPQYQIVVLEFAQARRRCVNGIILMVKSTGFWRAVSYPSIWLFSKDSSWLKAAVFMEEMLKVLLEKIVMGFPYSYRIYKRSNFRPLTWEILQKSRYFGYVLMSSLVRDGISSFPSTLRGLL